MQGDPQKCLDAGMNDFVSKPVVVATLVTALRRWLTPKATAAAPVEEAAPAVVLPPPPLDAPRAVFERATLLERVMDDEEFARELAGDFLEDMPRQITKLKVATAAADAAECGRTAHRIKGACAAVGAEALRALAARLEEDGSAGEIGALAARLTEVDAQFELLARAITTELQLTSH
jgi:HPt (histidine-containing phosphotransfer) domain-containing protein